MQWCGLKFPMLEICQRYSRRHHWCSGVDWNIFLAADPQAEVRHHWCSGVDWNSPVLKLIDTAESHHWCSGVDWNIEFASIFIEETSSPLMQWCGLKFVLFIVMIPQSFVTTDAVVWIEIIRRCRSRVVGLVTTDAVVWIEINEFFASSSPSLSPLMQWCGLKC